MSTRSLCCCRCFNSRIGARSGECRAPALPRCQIDGRTPSRIVFPHRLLNYSGQGFLWGDPGSSRQTDTAGRPVGHRPARDARDHCGKKKNSQPPQLVLQSKRVSLRAALQTSAVATPLNREPRDWRGAAVPGGAPCKINGRTWQFSHCSHLLLRLQRETRWCHTATNKTAAKLLVPRIWSFWV